MLEWPFWLLQLFLSFFLIFLFYLNYFEYLGANQSKKAAMKIAAFYIWFGSKLTKIIPEE